VPEIAPSNSAFVEGNSLFRGRCSTVRCTGCHVEETLHFGSLFALAHLPLFELQQQRK